MLPILITQFAQAGLGLIDTIMAGHLSAADLAAIAVGVGLWIPVMLLFAGIMIAATPLVAEARGAKTPEKNSNDCSPIFVGRFHPRYFGNADLASNANATATFRRTRSLIT